MYDHLHATEDIEKEISMCAQQIFKHLGTYLMKGAVIGQTLFEVAESSSQQADELRPELSKMKEAQVISQALLSSANKRLIGMENDLYSAQSGKLSQVKQEATLFRGTIKKLKKDLKKDHMNEFLSGD